MSIKESPIYKKVKTHEKVDIGDLYFFDNYVIGEFKEGISVDFKQFSQCTKLISAFYGNAGFGFIANRVNSYSIVLTDAHLFNDYFKNLKAYATVSYIAFSEKITEVENHFFNFNKRDFGSLVEAITWVEETLKD
ncbi:hypothetical protein KO566_05305 [Flavobacteriaceae bacterium XHP0103]|uniref:hypothetical protein n=1 Tax=Marixanthotalea marina TaxID=2844359 RepID=UPI002989D96F|nr:hypothetical protein [Marixanthotalea marina]MBU3821469.1 hypothetical protein [Marixanthotalea marina]